MALAGGDPLAAHRALSMWTRVAILSQLRQAPQPLSSSELAQRTGLHVNTVRFHLQILAQAGLVEPGLEHRPQRGRPRRVWSATDEEGADLEGGYQMLAEVLAEYLARASDQPWEAGERLGESWGSRLARSERRSRQEGVEQVVAMMAALGFSPTLARDGERFRLELHSCPFLEVAKRNQEVVCAAHLGLLRGALAEMGLPLTATRLDPLVEPSLCVAQLSPVSPRRRRGAARPRSAA